jgi:hypothetical protein
MFFLCRKSFFDIKQRLSNRVILLIVSLPALTLLVSSIDLGKVFDIDLVITFARRVDQGQQQMLV